MGMDLGYQAIPDDSPALERARQDAVFCCELEFWSSRARPDAMYDAMACQAAKSDAPEDLAFVAALRLTRQTARDRPGMQDRAFTWPGRGYAAIYYLLSPAYRAGFGNWSEFHDWAGEAIFGAQVLGAGVTTIGFKIRYTPPHLVREYAELLQLISAEDLREHFDPQKMVDAAVYKYFGDPDAFEEWMWPQFQAWREFLLSMLGFPDEGLICCIS